MRRKILLPWSFTDSCTANPQSIFYIVLFRKRHVCSSVSPEQTCDWWTTQEGYLAMYKATGIGGGWRNFLDSLNSLNSLYFFFLLTTDVFSFFAASKSVWKSSVLSSVNFIFRMSNLRSWMWSLKPETGASPRYFLCFWKCKFCCSLKLLSKVFSCTCRLWLYLLKKWSLPRSNCFTSFSNSKIIYLKKNSTN